MLKLEISFLFCFRKFNRANSIEQMLWNKNWSNVQAWELKKLFDNQRRLNFEFSLSPLERGWKASLRCWAFVYFGPKKRKQFHRDRSSNNTLKNRPNNANSDYENEKETEVLRKIFSENLLFKKWQKILKHISGKFL